MLKGVRYDRVQVSRWHLHPKHLAMRRRARLQRRIWRDEVQWVQYYIDIIYVNFFFIVYFYNWLLYFIWEKKNFSHLVHSFSASPMHGEAVRLLLSKVHTGGVQVRRRRRLRRRQWRGELSCNKELLQTRRIQVSRKSQQHFYFFIFNKLSLLFQHDLLWKNINRRCNYLAIAWKKNS